MTYLVDTSVLTRLRNATVAQRLRVLDVAGLARAPITDLEIGFSASNEREWDKLIAALAAFDPVEVVPDDFIRALALQRRLARAGLKGRKVPDLLVAAVAEGRSFTVLHYDADFDHIQAVTGQPAEWVVPPGTIN